MIKNELINLINDNEIWAFVGSGPSVDSGYPSWYKLIEDVVDNIKNKEDLLKDIDFQRYRDNGKYPDCFSMIEEVIGREKLLKLVTRILSHNKNAGKISNYIAEFPFKGYITSNYDDLIERTLFNNNQPGWISIGNTQNEIDNTTGSPKKIVWHIHGSTNLEKDRSNLILTQKDYDNLYLVPNPMIEQIKSLMSQNRLLFIGFGFNDFELQRILNKIGMFCSPARPAYAFLGFDKGIKERPHDEMLKKMNIDLIDYDVEKHSHRKLEDLLEIYSSMILKRSQQFGGEKRKCPSYDPETTSLLIFNELVIKSNIKFDENVVILIIQSLILTLLKTRDNITTENMIELISSRVSLLSTYNISKINTSSECFKKAISDSLLNGYISSKTVDSQLKFSLTPQGDGYFTKSHGTMKRIKLQFISSTKTRLSRNVDINIDEINSISEIILTFINDLVEKRSIGVQFASHVKESEERDYHILALMKSIPEYLTQLENHQQALAFINVIKEIFTNPTDEERSYIGLSLQARFSIHLLGLDQNMLKLRIKELKNSFYIIDSSIIIPLLAISSSAHKSALKLIKSLKKNNCMIITTPLLHYEVKEHLCWAYNKIKDSNNNQSILNYFLSQSGNRQNAFLNAYIKEVASGNLNDFDSYLQKIFQVVTLKKITPNDFEGYIEKSLSKYELNIIDIRNLHGFKEEFLFEIDDNQSKIKEIRMKQNSFKHDRQVEAEAVALTMIKKIRSSELFIDDASLENGYFVSNTKILDELLDDELPVVLKLDTLLQIVASLDNWSIDELGFLTDSLVREFQSRVMNVLDYRNFRSIFSPLIHATKKDYNEHYEHFKNIYRLKYNEDLEEAVKNLNDIEFPVFWDNFLSQMTEDLEIELSKVYGKLNEAEKKKLYISPKDWQMLWELKRKKRLRKIKDKERREKKK